MEQPVDTMRDPRRSIVLSTLAKALPLIIGVTAIFGAAGVLLSQYQEKVFTSTTEVLLTSTRTFDPLGEGGGNGAPGRFVANQQQIMGSRQVLEDASAQLAADLDPSNDASASVLAANLDVAGAADSDVIVLTTTGPTSKQAAERGFVIAAAYERLRAGEVTTIADTARQSLTAAAESAATVARAVNPEAVADLTQVAEVTSQAAQYGDGVQLLEPPTESPDPTEPNPLRNGFLLGALGLLLTTGLVIWRRGQPVADRGVLVESAGAPVLGVVPVPMRRLSRRKAPPLPQARDFSMALVALGYAATDPSGVVMITGITRDSGAPSVALGLAAAAAEQQRRVVVVDADTQGLDLVRHSGQEGPELPIGALADPATEEHRAVTELVRLRPAAGDGAVHLASVAASVRTRGGPDAVRDGLQRLVDSFDMVVLHAGPVADDPMAFALLREASVVVGVVDETARTSDLLALREKLELAGTRADGLVLTRPATSRRRPAPTPVPATIPEVFGSTPQTPEAHPEAPAPARQAPVAGQAASAPAGGATAIRPASGGSKVAAERTGTAGR